MRTLLFALLALALSTGSAIAQTGAPLAQVVTESVRDCSLDETQDMPLIAWGADAVTIYANGGTMTPSEGLFSDNGTPLNLSVEDDFANQLRSYLTCESPFLRGTLGMLTAAAPVTEADARTEQVVIFKHSWSAGDAIVGDENIKSVKDLVGKKIAIQAYGPHVAFVGRVLVDSGVSLRDVDIVWATDLTGEDSDTPSALLASGEADAAAVILPDARALTSGGAVGTGAEGSVRGAEIIFSTQEASSVIGDYISVRADVFDAQRERIKSMVASLLASEEIVRRFMAQDGSPEQQKLAKTIADELLGGLPAEEGVFLWRDAITDGWTGNAKHFADQKNPRRFDVLMEEVSGSLISAGMIERPFRLADAEWDYASLAEGLDDVSDRAVAAFNPEAAAAAVNRLRRTGRLDENTKIDFKVYFEPDTTEFPVTMYAEDFDEIVRLAATYSGAIITVEGHADPLHYLRREKDGAASKELRAIRTSAKNLSFSRAQSVVSALNEYASEEGILINENQFIVDGVGIDQPAFNPPKSADEWRQNMQVVFRILTTQAEATTFAPLD
ncbi:ABC transporter substrate-binding protein [bacterium]|nr:ABC transporter substrate-binding protein [bacterium]